MDVNDNAFFLNKRVDRDSIASRLAPTGKAIPRTTHASASHSAME
mgnify:CR=1 FL=1